MKENRPQGWGWVFFESALMRGKTMLLSFVAWILIGYGAIAILMCIVALLEGATLLYPSRLIIIPIFIVGGILLLRVVSKIKKNAVKYKKYVDFVVNHRVTALDNLANAVGLQYETVKSDLQTMIEKGYFPDAYINEGTREIVLVAHQTAPLLNPQEAARVFANATTCKNCGANNAAANGQERLCEYCGSPL